MTAEECLLCSLFAMVSSDCHVRNARARTTGLGMLPSETSLADEIWNLHLSTGPHIHLYILFTIHLNPSSLCLGDLICLSQSQSRKGNVILKLQRLHKVAFFTLGDTLLLFLQTSSLKKKKHPYAARGPVMAFIMNHIIQKIQQQKTTCLRVFSAISNL